MTSSAQRVLASCRRTWYCSAGVAASVVWHLFIVMALASRRSSLCFAHLSMGCLMPSMLRCLTSVSTTCKYTGCLHTYLGRGRCSGGSDIRDLLETRIGEWSDTSCCTIFVTGVVTLEVELSCIKVHAGIDEYMRSILEAVVILALTPSAFSKILVPNLVGAFCACSVIVESVRDQRLCSVASLLMMRSLSKRLFKT